MRRHIVWTFIVVTVSSMALIADYADAGSRKSLHEGEGYGYVTAESRFGTGIVSGPVRRGPYGRLEVGLPRGTWIECGRSCSETLRRETVDFWYNHRGDRHTDKVDGPGYFSFYFY
jgi:hypothetical protein